MTPDEYKVLDMAVRDGVAIGYRRAFKYDDNPSEDAVIEKISENVMTQISEWFRFREIADND